LIAKLHSFPFSLSQGTSNQSTRGKTKENDYFPFILIISLSQERSKLKSQTPPIILKEKRK